MQKRKNIIKTRNFFIRTVFLFSGGEKRENKNSFFVQPISMPIFIHYPFNSCFI